MGLWQTTKQQSKDTAGLLKNTFKVFWQDTDLFSPVIRLSAYELIHYTALLTGVLLLVLTDLYTAGFITIAASLTVIPLFKYYYTAFQKSVLSHGTYQVIQGKDATYKGSKQAISDKEGSIVLLAITDAIITKFLNSADDGDNTGITGFIINMLIAAAEEVWDLLENYLVPAIVVDDVSLTDVPSKLKALKNNVPGALTGVFGLDLGTTVLGQFLFPAILITWVALGGIGYATSGITTHTFTVSGITIAYIPLIIAAYISMIISGLVAVITESLKATYFTAMYVAIQHPDRIEDSRRSSLTNYLSLDDDIDTPSTKTEAASEHHENVPKRVRQLAKVFERTAKPGNKETLFDKAKNKGFNDEQIQTAWDLADTP